MAKISWELCHFDKNARLENSIMTDRIFINDGEFPWSRLETLHHIPHHCFHHSRRERVKKVYICIVIKCGKFSCIAAKEFNVWYL